MTRENKLALIIGFGLILVVGILVSDHFSTAAQQKNAKLAEPSGFAGAGANSLEPVELNGGSDRGMRPGPLVMSGAHADRNLTTPRNNRQPSASDGDRLSTIDIPDLQELSQRANQARRDEEAQGIKRRTIKPGETLAGIAKQEYGQESLWRELAAFNSGRIPNPSMVPAGVTIRIPTRAILSSGTSAPPTNPAPSRTEPLPQPQGADPPFAMPPNGTAPKYQIYTIQPGDVLSVISQRLLGTSRRYLEIYELNRDVLPSPDRVIVGAEIRIPKS